MNSRFKKYRFRLKWSWPLLLLTAAMLLQLGGCAGMSSWRIPGRQVPDQVALATAEKELTDTELLNVSIKVFDPGKLPDNENGRRGLSPEIRAAEARFIPIHLKYTMQRSGYWGLVRVVPDDDNGTEVLVRGRIEYSDGKSGAIDIEVIDARNVVWFHKIYAETTEHQERGQTEPEKQDVFQDLFNTITNDMIQYRNRLSPAEIEEIKQAAELRYARAMAPDAFAGYLTEDPDGTINILRLPAKDDTMLKRIRSIRARDDMLVDMINGYYEAYYLDLWEPYNNWRKFRSKEVEVMEKLERQALTRQVLGVAAIVGAIALSASGNSETRAQTSSLRDVMIMGGAAGIYSGYQKKKETAINKEVIEELGASFSSEAEPLVIEVEGETVRLKGSAEQQYTRWRELLRQIYARETGLIPVDTTIQLEKSEKNPPAATLDE
ncbi:MAG: hypothetical protein U9P07_07740 [Pseudomonadota bacterium]|nr:hypothetical protein [Pseudomonadota bacterium]